MTTTSPPPVDRDLLDFAVSVVAAAGSLAADWFFRGATRRRKDDGSEVTEADLAVEELIRGEVARRTPDDGVLGEETGESPGRSGRRWVIDPISGTAYFSRRMPLFAQLLAYEDEFGCALGIIGMPVQREIVFAGRGLGCWLLSGRDTPVAQARRTWVSDRPTLDGALTLTSNQHTWTHELLGALHGRVTLAGAVHHHVLHLVTGRVDIAVGTAQAYDDLAPLPVLVAEAGGVVTDLLGHPVPSGAGTMLAANPAVHREALALVAGLPHASGPTT
ncbi:inositol monophosphatase family protein [Asanoa sp. NPDC049573]|uniref:inositol monophosphatase family protein n=1 Tax=Asanoa sp. NPDC049573 TaxID=3155396 RepID=UPI003441BFDC